MTRRALNARGELTEHAWQRQVVALARFYGWRIYHAPAGGKQGRVDREQIGRGFPDLTLTRDGQLIFAELKTARGRPTADQLAWLADLERVPGAAAYLWRPDDFDEVERTLSVGRVRQRPTWKPDADDLDAARDLLSESGLAKLDAAEAELDRRTFGA